MPGRQKKAQGNKDNGGPLEPTQNQQQAQVSDPDTSKDDTSKGDTSQTCVDENDKPDFTKSLIVALNDPAVKAGIAAIIKPLICAYVDEIIQPMVTKQVSEALKLQDNKLTDMENEISMMNFTINDHCAKSTSSNEKIVERINELEKSTRNKNLRITGLNPANPDSTQNLSSPDMYAVAFNSMITEAGIDDVTAGDVTEFVKINTPNQLGSSHTVLLKFSSETKRNKLFFQKKKLKNCSKKYFINEDLTREVARTFKKTRQEVKAGKLHACWTKGGTIWAKSAPDGTPFSIPN